MKKLSKFILGIGIGTTIASGAMLAHYFKKHNDLKQPETSVEQPSNPYNLPIVEVDAECCISEKLAFAALSMIDVTGNFLFSTYRNPIGLRLYINYLNELNGLSLTGDSIFCTCAVKSDNIDHDNLENDKLYGYINGTRIAMRIEHIRYPLVMPIDLLRNAEEGDIVTIYLPGVYNPSGCTLERKEVYGDDYNRCIIKLNMTINQKLYDIDNINYRKTMKEIIAKREIQFHSDQEWSKRRAIERLKEQSN